MEETDNCDFFFFLKLPILGDAVRLQTNNTKDGPLRSGQQVNETQPVVSEAALWMKSQPGIGAGSLQSPTPESLAGNSMDPKEVKQFPYDKMKLLYKQPSPYFFQISGLCPHRLWGLDFCSPLRWNVFYVNYPSHRPIKSHGPKKQLSESDKLIDM